MSVSFIDTSFRLEISFATFQYELGKHTHQQPPRDPPTIPTLLTNNLHATH